MTTRLACPECHSPDIRISAELSVTFRPNDPDEPFENDVFIAFVATWDFRSDAWCEICFWHGQAGDLFKLSEIEPIA